MRQIKKIALVLSACSILFSTNSLADDHTKNVTLSNFSYDYYEARIGISPVTYGAGVVFSVHPNAHVRIEVDTEFDSDFDSTIAGGFHAPVNDWADIYGEMGMRSTKMPHRYSGHTEFGIEAVFGVRQWLGPQLEVGAEIGHVSIANDNDLFGNVSARFHATELFSIGGQFRINDAYDEQLLLTTRFKF